MAGDINQLQNQIEEINKNYDQLISNATKEIEEFVEKVNLKTKLHSEQVIYQKKILNLRKKQHFNNSIDANKVIRLIKKIQLKVKKLEFTIHQIMK